MEGDSGKEESYQRLLDLISTERGRMVNGGGGGFAAAEEKKLELRLGPPGDWSVKENTSSSSSSRRERDESLLSLGCFSGGNKNSNHSAGASSKRGFLDTVKEESGAVNQTQKLSLFPSPWPSSSPSTLQKAPQQLKPAFLQLRSLPSLPVLSKESSQANGTKVEQQNHQREEACYPASAPAPANTAVATSSQTRTPSVPVVGWPPIRSYRKNLASSSLKPSPESQHGASKEAEKPGSSRKGLFVKINMDGVPIGRKIDLKAYNSYEKLFCAVDELFRGLLAAQGDSLAAGNQNNSEERPLLKGFLDGSGEYTLIYEDNEGDKMLVGDVPWDMFVTAVKRLRVLKSSELSTLRCGSRQGKTTVS